MIRRPLHTHIAFVHDSFVAIIQNQLDRSFEDDSKVHTVREVHKVHIIRCLAHSGKVDDPAEHPGLVDQANLLAMVVNKW